jgi:hypothetical protein
MDTGFKKFYAKSLEFREALHRKIKEVPYTKEAEKRILAALTLLDIAIEHGESIHLLAANNCYISATSLLRLQYEATLKAAWIYWVAKDHIIDKWYQSLNETNIKRVDNSTPTLTEILQELSIGVEKGIVPNKAFTLLKEFRQQHKMSNSYVHSSMLAFSRKKEGYPTGSMIQIMQNSNGLEALCCMMVGDMMQDGEIMQYLLNIQLLYLDCLPMQLPDIINTFYKN